MLYIALTSQFPSDISYLALTYRFEMVIL